MKYRSDKNIKEDLPEKENIFIKKEDEEKLKTMEEDEEDDRKKERDFEVMETFIAENVGDLQDKDRKTLLCHCFLETLYRYSILSNLLPLKDKEIQNILETIESLEDTIVTQSRFFIPTIELLKKIYESLVLFRQYKFIGNHQEIDQDSISKFYIINKKEFNSNSLELTWDDDKLKYKEIICLHIINIALKALANEKETNTKEFSLYLSQLIRKEKFFINHIISGTRIPIPKQIFSPDYKYFCKFFLFALFFVNDLQFHSYSLNDLDNYFFSEIWNKLGDIPDISTKPIIREPRWTDEIIFYLKKLKKKENEYYYQESNDILFLKENDKISHIFHPNIHVYSSKSKIHIDLSLIEFKDECKIEQNCDFIENCRGLFHVELNIENIFLDIPDTFLYLVPDHFDAIKQMNEKEKYKVKYFLEKLIHEIEVPDQIKQSANECINKIEKEVKRQIKIKEFRVSGSYSRDTIIHPLNEIDLFIVLNQYFKLEYKEHPRDFLEMISRSLDKSNLPIKNLRIKNRSVGFQFNKLQFDIVPVFPINGKEGYYWIADVVEKKWIEISPFFHSQALEDLNKDTRGLAKNVIRLIKYWFRQQKLKNANEFARGAYNIESFLIERTVVNNEEVNQKLRKYSQNNSNAMILQKSLRATFDWVRVENPNIGTDSEGLKGRAITIAFNTIIDACEAEKKGEFEKSLKLWQALFSDRLE